MAGGNKSSLQHCCTAAGLSTEGTKTSSVNVNEAIIYKGALQVPQTNEASTAQSCLHEIEQEPQTGISAVGLTGGACWCNPAGLRKLDSAETCSRS